MYLVGEYFIECYPEQISADRWTAWAKISRRNDYRRFASVPTVEYPTGVQTNTRATAERAGVDWAKVLIANKRDELEESLEQSLSAP
jgi:hypothetical protein